MKIEFRETCFAYHLLVYFRIRICPLISVIEGFPYRFDVHAGRSAIYDHRRALKASRLNLLNASRYNVALRDISFFHLLFLCFSLFLSSLPFTFLFLYLSFVRALHGHIHKSRKCMRTCAYARRLNTYERLTRIERSTRPNYFKLSYNRIKLPIIGDCIA